MTKNRTPTPVYLDPGMHPGLEVKGLRQVQPTSVLKGLNAYYLLLFSFLMRCELLLQLPPQDEEETPLIKYPHLIYQIQKYLF